MPMVRKGKSLKGTTSNEETLVAGHINNNLYDLVTAIQVLTSEIEELKSELEEHTKHLKDISYHTSQS